MFEKSYQEWQRDWPCEATATAGWTDVGIFLIRTKQAQVPNPAPCVAKVALGGKMRCVKARNRLESHFATLSRIFLN